MNLKICPGLWEMPRVRSFQWAEKQVMWWGRGCASAGKPVLHSCSFPGQLSDQGGVAASAGLWFHGTSSKELAQENPPLPSGSNTLYSVAQGWRDLTMCKESRWQLRKVNNLKPKFDRTVPLPAHKSISLWGTVIGQNWSNLIGVLEPVKLLVSKCSVNSLVLEEG